MQESFTRLEIIFAITVAIIGFTWPGALWLGSVIWERKKRAKRIKYMPLYCLRCKTTYNIPMWAMKHMTYREYSYCNKCHKIKEGKPRRIFAKMFTYKTGRKKKWKD